MERQPRERKIFFESRSSQMSSPGRRITPTFRGRETITAMWSSSPNRRVVNNDRNATVDGPLASQRWKRNRDRYSTGRDRRVDYSRRHVANERGGRNRDRNRDRYSAGHYRRVDYSRRHVANERRRNLERARFHQHLPLENIHNEEIHVDGEEDLTDASDLIVAPTEREQRFMYFDHEGNLITQEDPIDGVEMFDENTDQDAQEEMLEIQKLLSILPHELRAALENHPSLPIIEELVLDLGRNAELRCKDHNQQLSTCITSDHILQIVNQLNQRNHKFHDNRCGVDGTIHRISRRVGQDGKVILGFTMRFGKMKKGITRIISDLIAKRKSVLFIGRPGVGKTTILREYARKLAGETVGVEVIDKNNEIGGDSSVPHRCIGNARRLMVPIGKTQYDVLREAVQNHAPQCIIVDEVVKKEEAEALADISKRGVKVVATIHADNLEKVVDNYQLNVLTGGKRFETVSDRFFIDNNLKGKTIVKRAFEPSFDCLVEVRSWHRWVVHLNLKKAVDHILESSWRRGIPKLSREFRTYSEDGQMVLEYSN